MTAIPTLLRRALQLENPSLRRLFAAFSSSWSKPRVSNSFCDEEEGISTLYKQKLRFQCPRLPKFMNSVSFIGTVAQPLKSHETGGERSAYTVLRVSDSSQSNESFSILLQMRDEMAKICFEHLKENDYIYVSGRLGTDTKADRNGNLRLLYKVIVKELNYITGRYDSNSRSNEELQPVEGGLTILEKHRNRLHLWQIFFSSPHEWWDNRKGKTNPNRPDFFHKDTREALWLSPNDPPWVSKQLQLLDSRMALRGEGGLTILEKRRNRLHLWQIFFSSSHEWWDNRKGKTNPNNPDFRHKDTREALWLSPNDPPWVSKQIQLLDSRMAMWGEGEPTGRRARLSKWEFDA